MSEILDEIDLVDRYTDKNDRCVIFKGKRNFSDIIYKDTLEEPNAYWDLFKTIKYLDIQKYNLNLIWAILYHLELSITIYKNNLYFKQAELLNIGKEIDDIKENYMSFRNLNTLFHENKSIQLMDKQVYIPPNIFYYLIPEPHKGFYFANKISLDIIEQVYNDQINCEKFLTYAETQNDLSLLKAKIPTILASYLLQNVDKLCF